MKPLREANMSGRPCGLSGRAIAERSSKNAGILAIDKRNAFVIGKEHLVAMWPFAGRGKDYQKIAMFVDADILDIERLTNILERHDLLVKWEAGKWRFTNEQH